MGHAVDLVRRAEADFEELVVRPKKYSASVYPVWTLPGVAYHFQSAEFDKNPKEELVKPDITVCSNLRVPKDLREHRMYSSSQSFVA